MSTEMTQVPGAAAAQTPTNPTAAQPTAEQPKTDTPATPANPAPAVPEAPKEPEAVAETSWLEEETLGLSNRTWCEIIGTIAVAATGYFVGQYMAKSDDAAPAV